MKDSQFIIFLVLLLTSCTSEDCNKSVIIEETKQTLYFPIKIDALENIKFDDSGKYHIRYNDLKFCSSASTFLESIFTYTKDSMYAFYLKVYVDSVNSSPPFQVSKDSTLLKFGEDIKTFFVRSDDKVFVSNLQKTSWPLDSQLINAFEQALLLKERKDNYIKEEKNLLTLVYKKDDLSIQNSSIRLSHDEKLKNLILWLDSLLLS